MFGALRVRDGQRLAVWIAVIAAFALVLSACGGASVESACATLDELADEAAGGSEGTILSESMAQDLILELVPEWHRRLQSVASALSEADDEVMRRTAKTLAAAVEVALEEEAERPEGGGDWARLSGLIASLRSRCEIAGL